MLFADDLILVSETAFNLQKLITGLETYCEHWQMAVDLRKTEICVFHKKFCYKRRVSKFKAIEEIENYNVLGTTFYSGARCFQSNYYNRLQEKATRAIFTAKQLAYNRMGNQIPFSVLLKFWYTNPAHYWLWLRGLVPREANHPYQKISIKTSLKENLAYKDRHQTYLSMAKLVAIH